MHLSSDSARAHPLLYRIRRFMRVRYASIDGLTLLAYRHDIPKHVSQLLVRGDYEVPERRAVSHLLRTGDRVLEVGGCVGVVALTAARIVGAENVRSFEPNPMAAKVARENFKLNSLPIELTCAAVGVLDGEIELRVSSESWLGASARRQFEGQTIVSPMRSLAAIVHEFQPTVLVMDTEGMEAELLAACPLLGLRALVVEVHRDVIGADGVDALGRNLLASGFVMSSELSSAETQTWIRMNGVAGG